MSRLTPRTACSGTPRRWNVTCRSRTLARGATLGAAAGDTVSDVVVASLSAEMLTAQPLVFRSGDCSKSAAVAGVRLHIPLPKSKTVARDGQATPPCLSHCAEVPKVPARLRPSWQRPGPGDLPSRLLNDTVRRRNESFTARPSRGNPPL